MAKKITTKVLFALCMLITVCSICACSLTKEFKVRFYVDDVVYQEIDVPEGKDASLPENPTKESTAQYSYSFEKWIDAQGNDAVFTGITANTDVYAKFTETVNKYTLSIDADGGSVKKDDAEVTSLSLDYGTVISGLGLVAEKEHYHFVKWEINDGDDYRDLESTDAIESNASVKAVWAIDTFTLAINANGGSVKKDGAEVTSLTVEYGTKISELGLVATTSEEHYHFAKWQIKESGDYVDLTSDKIMSEYAILKPVFEMDKVSVKYMADDVEYKTVSKDYGTSASEFAVPYPEVLNKHFAGWTLDGSDYTLDGNITEDITLVAKWDGIPVVTINNFASDSVKASPNKGSVTYLESFAGRSGVSKVVAGVPAANNTDWTNITIPKSALKEAHEDSNFVVFSVYIVDPNNEIQRIHFGNGTVNNGVDYPLTVLNENLTKNAWFDVVLPVSSLLECYDNFVVSTVRWIGSGKTPSDSLTVYFDDIYTICRPEIELSGSIAEVFVNAEITLPTATATMANGATLSAISYSMINPDKTETAISDISQKFIPTVAGDYTLKASVSAYDGKMLAEDSITFTVAKFKKIMVNDFATSGSDILCNTGSVTYVDSFAGETGLYMSNCYTKEWQNINIQITGRSELSAHTDNSSNIIVFKMYIADASNDLVSLAFPNGVTKLAKDLPKNQWFELEFVFDYYSTNYDSVWTIAMRRTKRDSAPTSPVLNIYFDAIYTISSPKNSFNDYSESTQIGVCNTRNSCSSYEDTYQGKTGVWKLTVPKDKTWANYTITTQTEKSEHADDNYIVFVIYVDDADSKIQQIQFSQMDAKYYVTSLTRGQWVEIVLPIDCFLTNYELLGTAPTYNINIQRTTTGNDCAVYIDEIYTTYIPE